MVQNLDVQNLSADSIFSKKTASKDSYQAWKKIGSEIISREAIAIITLAGGQGTRLGFDRPKGMFTVPGINKTLFQLHAEKIKGVVDHYKATNVYWYIMVSDPTEMETRKYFGANNFFNLNVRFFKQSNHVNIDFSKKPIIDDLVFGLPVQSISPNGSGGIYQALADFHIINEMIANNVKYIEICNVDNVNAKPIDPVNFGIMRSQQLDCLCKAIELDEETKKGCGLFCLKDGLPGVIEYFEASENDRQSLHLGNIAVYIYSIGFLQRCVENNHLLQQHHSAKKIPYYDSVQKRRVTPKENNGYKSELFIFDLFNLCLPERFAVTVVDVDEEFAPIKNKSGKSSPEDAFERYQKGFNSLYYV